MEITLCEKDFGENVPTLEFTDLNAAYSCIHNWLISRDMENNTYVCFVSYKKGGPNSILVGDSWDEITDFVDNLMDTNVKYINFFIYEFANFKDAFDFCEILKEA